MLIIYWFNLTFKIYTRKNSLYSSSNIFSLTTKFIPIILHVKNNIVMQKYTLVELNIYIHPYGILWWRNSNVLEVIKY